MKQNEYIERTLGYSALTVEQEKGLESVQPKLPPWSPGKEEQARPKATEGNKNKEQKLLLFCSWKNNEIKLLLWKDRACKTLAIIVTKGRELSIFGITQEIFLTSKE